MKLEQPKISISSTGDLKERVAYLERYIFRLAQVLQTALDALEQKKGG